MTELHTFTLPAGTVCKRNGIPFRLQHATQIECHPDNWELIRSQKVEPKVVADARLEAAKEGLRNSAVRLSAAWTEVLQQSPAEIVREKYRNSVSLANASSCSAESRPRTPLKALLFPAVGCLSFSAAIALLALHVVRKASSGKGAASSDLGGSQ